MIWAAKRTLILLAALQFAQAATSNAPVITKPPSDEYIGKSGSAIISCEAKYASELVIVCNDEWFYSGKLLDQKKWQDDDGIPHISSSIRIRKEKITSYYGEKPFSCRCVAGPLATVGGDKSYSKSAKIQLAYLNKEFRNEPSNVDKKVGDSVELHCQPPTGLPEPQVFWLKDGKPVDEKDGNFITNSFDNQLIIRAAREKDSGEYICMASNGLTSRESKPARIDVYTDGGWGIWSAWSKCPTSRTKCIKGDYSLILGAENLRKFVLQQIFVNSRRSQAGRSLHMPNTHYDIDSL